MNHTHFLLRYTTVLFNGYSSKPNLLRLPFVTSPETLRLIDLCALIDYLVHNLGSVSVLESIVFSPSFHLRVLLIVPGCIRSYVVKLVFPS